MSGADHRIARLVLYCNIYVYPASTLLQHRNILHWFASAWKILSVRVMAMFPYYFCYIA